VDLLPYLGWIVFLHVAGAFAFVAGHGVSMFVAFQLRRERDRGRLAALLERSARSLTTAGIGLLVLFISGIVAGLVLGSFGEAWIWVSLVLLVVIAGTMTPIGTAYLGGIRRALGQRTRAVKPGEPDPIPATDAELAILLDSRRPEQLLLLGGGGFLVILWLMMFRPF
jgi:peptidoglycan biosynthesis protein MviN/MurJ (putative lipid II flippase)